MVVPGFIMTLVLPFSILTGLTTFHLPFGNFWNEPHGALPVVCPYTTVEANGKDARTAGIKRYLIMRVLVLHQVFAVGSELR
jgi:hypothetical protein